MKWKNGALNDSSLSARPAPTRTLTLRACSTPFIKPPLLGDQKGFNKVS